MSAHLDAPRRIWLCADDYGMAPGVNAAIRELALRGRINATSVMVLAPHFDAAAAVSLSALNMDGARLALGLHVTLTAPYAPISAEFTPSRGGRFLSLPELMRMALARRLSPPALHAEIAAQLRTFVEAFGRPPDFLDGHQHVQLLPQIRDVFLKIAAAAAPRAWVRQCGRSAGARHLGDIKSLFLDVLSLGFRRKASRLGIRTNPAFAGAYLFSPNADFQRVFPRFLHGLPDGGLIMCHPGHVDAELEAIDPLTAHREREFAYFTSENFPRVLAEHNATLVS